MHIKRPPLVMRIMATMKNRQTISPMIGKTHHNPHIGPIHGPGPHMAHLQTYVVQYSSHSLISLGRQYPLANLDGITATYMMATLLVAEECESGAVGQHCPA
jgi:hypothetical protein